MRRLRERRKAAGLKPVVAWVPREPEAQSTYSSHRLPRVAAHGAIEQLFGCNITRGLCAALVFPTEYLRASNRRSSERPFPCASGVTALPETSDLIAHVEQMIVLGLLDRRPRQDWLCRRLGISRRSLQRSLASRDTSFQEILRRELLGQAADRLACTRIPITQIALDLGYTDPAHFTRAFVRFFGESPQAWRRRAEKCR